MDDGKRSRCFGTRIVQHGYFLHSEWQKTAELDCIGCQDCEKPDDVLWERHKKLEAERDRLKAEVEEWKDKYYDSRGAVEKICNYLNITSQRTLSENYVMDIAKRALKKEYNDENVPVLRTIFTIK